MPCSNVKECACPKTACPNHSKSTPADAERKALSKPVTYTVDGRKFIVEPVFKDEAHETLGEILLKLLLDKENYQQN